MCIQFLDEQNFDYLMFEDFSSDSLHCHPSIPAWFTYLLFCILLLSANTYDPVHDAKQPIEGPIQPTVGLTYSCQQTEVKDRPTRLEVGVVISSKPSAVFGFVDQNHRYKSETTQIPHDAELSPIPYSGQKLFSHHGSKQLPSHSKSSKQYSLNCVTGRNGGKYL